MAGTGFRLDGVSVRLGASDVLRRVSLSVTAGETVALVGPSGAGKTTLLRLLNAAVEPDSGSVAVGGVDLATLGEADLRRHRARIGFVHQDLRLVPNLRVSQNVLGGGLGRLGLPATLRLFVRPPSSELERVHELLERVGIAEKMFERVDRLSGGQAQRVAVARALYQDPGILVADEPVASLDPQRAREVLGLLTGVCRENGITLVVTLHDPGLVREFFPRVIAVRDGEVVLDAAAEELSDAVLDGVFGAECGRGV